MTLTKMYKVSDTWVVMLEMPEVEQNYQLRTEFSELDVNQNGLVSGPYGSLHSTFQICTHRQGRSKRSKFHIYYIA